MKTPDECCSVAACGFCPYKHYCNVENGFAKMPNDALAYIQQLETREWELFDLLSSAWYGKGYYFKQDDGTVYSRASCQYLSFDQSIVEFATALTNAHEVE